MHRVSSELRGSYEFVSCFSTPSSVLVQHLYWWAAEIFQKIEDTTKYSTLKFIQHCQVGLCRGWDTVIPVVKKCSLTFAECSICVTFHVLKLLFVLHFMSSHQMWLSSKWAGFAHFGDRIGYIVPDRSAPSYKKLNAIWQHINLKKKKTLQC